MDYKRLIGLTGSLYMLSVTAVADSDALDRVSKSLTDRFPGVTVDSVTETPVAGLYQVSIGATVIYVSGDGRYMLRGKLIDLATGRDLTESVFAGLRLEQLAAVPEKKMIIYEPKGETKHGITTFTDIDCPYCRRMHKEMPVLNGSGVRVRYLLYPRTGAGSLSYKKAVAVWCADNQQAEMDLAKAGQMPTMQECENPVSEHMALAERLGLSGTPMTITDTGERIMGYVPADELVRRLAAAKAAGPR